MSVGVQKLLEQKCVATSNEVADLQARLAAIELGVSGRSHAFEETLKMLGDDPSTAALRRKFEDKIKKERQQLDEQKALLAEAMARLSGYKDAIKLMEKDAEEPSEPELRPGSELFKIREAVRMMGIPLTLAQMLEVLGEQDNPSKRNSVRGSIGRYARDNKIFVQTAPNTFGLLELGHKPASEPPGEITSVDV
jgi:hypothetical protein